MYNWHTIVGHVVGVFSCLIRILHFVPDLLCIVDKQLQFHNKRCAVNTYRKPYSAHALAYYLFTLICSYPFFPFIYVVPVATIGYVGAGHVSGGDGQVCWSHEGVESRGYHFGFGEATVALRKNWADDERLQIKGQLLTIPAAGKIKHVSGDAAWKLQSPDIPHRFLEWWNRRQCGKFPADSN